MGKGAVDLANNTHWGNSIGLPGHLGGWGDGETIQLGRGGMNRVGSCTSVQGLLHRVFKGVKDRCFTGC